MKDNYRFGNYMETAPRALLSVHSEPRDGKAR
jgi:hypothetical protein